MRTSTRFPQGCIYSWEMIRHAIGANTPHSLLTALLLLRAEPSFPSMYNPAEPKQSTKAFVKRSAYSCVTHFVGYCSHRSACTLNVPGLGVRRNRSRQHHCTALKSTTGVAWRGYEATSALSYGEITTSSNAAPQQDILKFKLRALIFGESLTTHL